MKRSLIRTAKKTEVISKLLLDINAAFYSDQIISEPAPAIEKSPAAIRGESLRGDIKLPAALQAVVEQAIEGAVYLDFDWREN